MKRIIAGIVLVGVAGAAFAEQVKVDAGIAGYQKASGVSGNVNSVGSDTMNNLMTLWAEAFNKHYLSVKVEVDSTCLLTTTDPPTKAPAPSVLWPTEMFSITSA